MNRFRYAGDRLCLVACGLYALNRWLWPLAWKTPFLRYHFNDLLFIPAALPPILWLHRQLNWRPAEAWPTWREIGEHLAVWSIAAEWIGPKLFAHAVSDPWDVLAYAVGALVAGLLWRWEQRVARAERALPCAAA